MPANLSTKKRKGEVEEDLDEESQKRKISTSLTAPGTISNEVATVAHSGSGKPMWIIANASRRDH